MYYTVYKVTNLVNGKFYIGKHQTNDLEDGYMGSGKIIRDAVRKYGIPNFHKEYLLVSASSQEMDMAERILVVVDKELSYNLSPGGEGGNVLRYANQSVHEAKSRAISKKIAGRTLSDEHKLQVSLNHQNVSGNNNPMWGKHHNDSSRKLLSERALNRERKECPHCSKIVDVSNFKRWHGVNCRVNSSSMTL